MTERLEHAIAEVRKLPEEMQDFVAETIFETLKAEQRWDELFADPRSHQFLDEMAKKVRANIKAGRVKKMGIDEIEPNGAVSTRAF